MVEKDLGTSQYCGLKGSWVYTKAEQVMLEKIQITEISCTFVS
jgi:hypothetical protein